MNCKICATNQIAYAQARILSKYDIQYFQCPSCGFIQTETPYWLGEAYTEVIASSDVGVVSRTISLAETTAHYISLLFNSNGRYLDYGGAYGMFVRAMRDKGFDFFWYDKYAKNLLSSGFEAKLNDSFDLVTSFEVLEHIADPLTEIEKMLHFSTNLLFSTQLIPASQPKPDHWQYFALETGQHVSFYSLKSLEVIANKFDLNLHSSGGYLHLMTPKNIPAPLFLLLTNKITWKFCRFFFARTSLHQADFNKITAGLYR